MSSTAREFAADPCSSVARGNMVRASRALLSAVTRLLILADMIDVHLLMKKVGLCSIFRIIKEENDLFWEKYKLGNMVRASRASYPQAPVIFFCPSLLFINSAKF